MKRILVALIVFLFSVFHVEAQSGKYRSYVSDPEKNIYVGTADASHVLNMYNDAFVEAFYNFYHANHSADDYEASMISGHCNIRFVKSEIRVSVRDRLCRIKP